MESQMDQLVQEKESVKETDTPIIPLVIPVITTTEASTLGEKLAPKEPLATAVEVSSILLQPQILLQHRFNKQMEQVRL